MVKYSQTTEKKGSVEMKGIRAAVLALGGAFLLAGCGGESGVLAPIPAEGFSQGVYDALEENWTAWEAVDELERMLSSTLPGHCAQEFDSWAQCADFLGPSIPDPAADCGWLEEATYAGMPLEASDAPRVKAEWYGTREGQVEWVSVQSGWRDGAVRVMVSAALYGTRAEDMPSDKGWGTELARQAYLEAAEAGTPVVTAESGASWCSVQAEHARGSVLYTIRAVGESGTEEQVRTSLNRVLETWLSAPEGEKTSKIC